MTPNSRDEQLLAVKLLFSDWLDLGTEALLSEEREAPANR